MQQNKTNSYVYYFVYFLLYMLAINVDDLTPDYLYPNRRRDPARVRTRTFLLPVTCSHHAAHAACYRLWSQIVSNFVIPQTGQLAVKDRKVAAVGLTRLLTQSTHSLKEPNVKAW